MTDQSYAFQNPESAHRSTICFWGSCIHCFLKHSLVIKALLRVLSRAGFSSVFVCCSVLLYRKNVSLICFDLLHVKYLTSYTRTCVCVCVWAEIDECVWTVLRLAYVLGGGSQQAAFNQKCLSSFNITFKPGLTPVPISLLPQHSSHLTHQITFCFPNKSSKGSEKLGVWWKLACVIFSAKSSWIGHFFVQS